MRDTYSADQFSFESRDTYEQAKKETEIIQQLIQKTDLSDARKSLKLYNKCISEKSFRTVAGYQFLVELRQSILESGLMSERTLAPIPVGEPERRRTDIITGPSSQEKRYERLYEGQKLLNKKLKIILGAVIIVVIGFVVINFRLEYSIFTYFTNYKATMEEELVDKYQKWQEDLEAREEKQRNLGKNQ